MNTIKNKVQLIGNLGNDPEIRHFDNGKKMARFSLATSEQYTDASGNRKKETQWHNLVMWGAQVGIAEKYLKKGSEIAIEGRLKNRSYEDKQGNKKIMTEIVVNEFMFLRNTKEA